MDALKALKRLSRSGHPEAERAARLLEELREERVYIGVFGTFSSGKSTVVDALLGHYLVPTKVVLNTAHGIFVQNGRPGLTIAYKSGEQRHVPLSSGLFRKSAAQEVIEKAAHRELGNAYERDAVDYYVLTYSAPFLGRHAVLVDTPGTNSPVEGHDLVALEAMDALDVAVYVINAQQPFSETDAKSIRCISERYQEVMVLVNKIDRFDHSEQRLEDFLEEIRAQLKAKGGLKDFYLYPVSAKGHLKTGGRDGAHNAFGEFKERLSFLIRKRAPAILREKIRDRIEREFPDFGSMLEKTKTAARAPRTKVRKEAASFPWARVLRAALTLLVAAGILGPAFLWARQMWRSPRIERWRRLGPTAMIGIYDRLNLRDRCQAERQALGQFLKDKGNRAGSTLYRQAKAAMLTLEGKSGEAARLLADRAALARLDAPSLFNLWIWGRPFTREDFNAWRVEIFLTMGGFVLLIVLTKLLRRALAFPLWIPGLLVCLAVAWGGFLFYFFVVSSGAPMTPDFNLRAWSGVAGLLYLALLAKPRGSRTRG